MCRVGEVGLRAGRGAAVSGRAQPSLGPRPWLARRSESRAIVLERGGASRRFSPQSSRASLPNGHDRWNFSTSCSPRSFSACATSDARFSATLALTFTEHCTSIFRSVPDRSFEMPFVPSRFQLSDGTQPLICMLAIDAVLALVGVSPAGAGAGSVPGCGPAPGAGSGAGPGRFLSSRGARSDSAFSFFTRNTASSNATSSFGISSASQMRSYPTAQSSLFRMGRS